MIEVEVEGLREVEVALGAAAAQAPERVRRIVQRGALNIKRDWQRRWSGHPHYPALPSAITYDATADLEAEIGPDKGRSQGALGNIIEFGTTKNPPLPGGVPALAAEEPRFAQALEDLVEDLTGA